MSKSIVLTCAIIIALCSFNKDERYEINGYVTAPVLQGNIYLKLVTKKQFSQKDGAIDSLLLKPGSEIEKLTYQFKGIPKGEYAIIGYQDLNNNNQLDMGTFKPKEPWCMSWQKKHFGPPFFKQCCFTLNKNKRIDLYLE